MLSWMWELLSTQSVASVILILSLVAASGLALGSVRVGSVSLGIGGVLFASIALSCLGFQVDLHILRFVKEFGLLLFIFTMGLQVGPGFFSSLRRQGLRLNALAATIVLIGALLTLGLVIVTGMPMATAGGLLAGSMTDPPTLAFSHTMTGGDASSVIYAAVYPLTMLLRVVSAQLLVLLWYT